jgi:hypothetical protein
MIPACIIRLVVVSCSEGFWRLASEQDGIVGMLRWDKEQIKGQMA